MTASEAYELWCEKEVERVVVSLFLDKIAEDQSWRSEVRDVMKSRFRWLTKDSKVLYTRFAKGRKIAGPRKTVKK